MRGPYSPPLSVRKVRATRHSHNPVMTVRQKKLTGTFLLLGLVIVWSLVAMALAQAPVLASSFPLQIAYYVFAGAGWIIPAMPLIKWMSGPKR